MASLSKNEKKPRAENARPLVLSPRFGLEKGPNTRPQHPKREAEAAEGTVRETRRACQLSLHCAAQGQLG